MASLNQPERRERHRNVQANPPAVYLTGSGPDEHSERLAAEILDISDSGVKVQIRRALVRGVVYKLETAASLAAREARVVWCRSSYSSVFHAGMAFVVKAKAEAPSQQSSGEEDLYELLQVNAKATPDTIHRVYRILAQRHHPDNLQTGNEDLFKRLTRGYEILADPSTRAAYDLRREQSHRTRAKLFTAMDSTDGKENEKRKRAAVLSVLYARRLQDPVTPSLTIFDIEELIGIPRDHLEFTLWYLRERAYLSRTDNNRFQITINGVDYAESLETQLNDTARVRSDRLLPGV